MSATLNVPPAFITMGPYSSLLPQFPPRLVKDVFDSCAEYLATIPNVDVDKHDNNWAVIFGSEADKLLFKFKWYDDPRFEQHRIDQEVIRKLLIYARELHENR